MAVRHLGQPGAAPVRSKKRYESPQLRPLDRRRWRLLVACTALIDLFALGTALTIATATRFGRDPGGVAPYDGRKLWLWLFLWWGSLVVAGLYERHRTDNFSEELRAIFNGVSLGTAVAITGAFFIKFDLSRVWAGLVWTFGLLLMIAGRLALRFGVRVLRRKGRLRRRAIVVGADDSARSLADAVRSATWEGVDVVGLIAAGTSGESLGPDVIGDLVDLRSIVVESRATEVLLASTVSEHFPSIVASLDELPVELRMAPGLEGFLASRLALHPMGDRALLAVGRVELRPSARAIKRAFDIVAGGFLTLIALPMITLCAIAVRLDSRGPAFFRQPRLGMGSREFRVWKLRTMVADAGERLAEAGERKDDSGVFTKGKQDPRVTRVGRFLRRTSLDELPQLFNVLRGDMSLVGPRPLLIEESAQYDTPLRRRLLVKPGMTGMWQVNGRSQTLEDYMRYDLLYVQNWSLALDMFLMIKTIPALLTGRGAY